MPGEGRSSAYAVAPSTNWDPSPPKTGMSTGAKVAIGLGIGFFLLIGIVVVSGILFVRTVADSPEFEAVFDVDETSALGPFDHPVGTCIDESNPLEPVSCDVEHSHEVFGTVRWEGGSAYPTYEDAYWQTLCEDEFESYVGIDYFESVLFYDTARPSPAAWDAGDRDIKCLAYEPGRSLFQSVRNARF